MTILRSRLALISLLLVAAVAALGFIALRTLPASSHGNVTALECNAAGGVGDLASLRGIQFSVNQSFVSVEVRLSGSVAGDYEMTAELRRSTGFTEPFVAAVRRSASLTTGPTAVHFDFPSQFVFFLFPATFTLKFTDITGPGTLYLSQTGVGNYPCPGVMETEENNVAVPTERSDPAGFKVLSVRSVRWGDVDCSNAVPSATDALKILRYVAGLSVAQTPPCPALADFVQP